MYIIDLILDGSSLIISILTHKSGLRLSLVDWIPQKSFSLFIQEFSELKKSLNVEVEQLRSVSVAFRIPFWFLWAVISSLKYP